MITMFDEERGAQPIARPAARACSTRRRTGSACAGSPGAAPGRPTTPRSAARCDEVEGGRRHARHLRRHPVRRASRLGRDAVRRARPRRRSSRCSDRSTDALFDEWIASGADAIIVTARAEFLDESWLGRPLRRDMLAEFARLGVDPCGERGEYHTAVTNSPLFSSPIDVAHGEHVLRVGLLGARPRGPRCRRRKYAADAAR